MNQGANNNFPISVVCAGGMGSSKFFFESITAFIEKGKHENIKSLNVGEQQASIAHGGVFLKAEKDYVDFNAPFI